MGILGKMLSALSGNNGMKVSEQLLFDKVIGFRGVVPGVGTSTIVQNVAVALSENTNMSICVLDTSFQYPSQYPLLLKGVDAQRSDFLSFTGELSDITLATSLKNVTLISMYNRTIVDMLSSRDNSDTMIRLIGTLKSYFDVILIDLSHEMTNINTHAAIKCNRIINVADQSIKSMYHLKKSLNNLATLAVPLAKADRIILNKVVPDVLTNTTGVIKEVGLHLVGEIPLSLEIAKAGVSGSKVWTKSKTNKDIKEFSSVIDDLLEMIITITPLNLEQVTGEEEKGGKAQKEEIVDEFISEEDSTDESVEEETLDSPVINTSVLEPSKEVDTKEDIDLFAPTELDDNLLKSVEEARKKLSAQTSKESKEG